MDFTLQEKYHLYNRAEFFVHNKDVNHNDDLKRTLENLFDKQNIKPLFIKLPKWDPKSFKTKSEKQKREIRKERRQQTKTLNYLWFKQMMEKDKGLQEKMTLFWHGHFATGYRTIENSYHMYLQNMFF